MRIHFIAIGGAIMHNLAIALQRTGHQISGSDDEIYEPSRSRLEACGLLPSQMGWVAERITADIDAIILGMHARADNPELLKAIELGISIQSFPEFVASQSRDKTRIVVAGSHGKTSTTSMIMHVLRSYTRLDYLVGAQLPEFELMVQISDASAIVIEGDEYLSSAMDRRPKFLHYDPHYLIITGIAWDHMNVFPTFEDYVDQFRQLLVALSPSTDIYAYAGDDVVRQLIAETGRNATFYEAFPHAHGSDGAFALHNGHKVPMRFFGEHNFQNMQAAWCVCNNWLDSPDAFLYQMKSFQGAAMRLDMLLDRDGLTVYRDFAHAPSKVRATVRALRTRYAQKPVTAIVELHTFSSLNKDFLPGYRGCLDGVEKALVYYSPHTLAMKKLPDITPVFVSECFGGQVEVHTTTESLLVALERPLQGVHLWMSSGRFGGLDIGAIYS